MATSTDSSLDTHTKWQFPTLINLNARSLSSEKVDELQAIVDLHTVSIVCIMETPRYLKVFAFSNFTPDNEDSCFGGEWRFSDHCATGLGWVKAQAMFLDILLA